MKYKISQVSKKLNIPTSTIRYYDSEGLLPFIERKSGKDRVFSESDFEWLKVIECMKKSGMSIQSIREYIQMALKGDETISARLELFRKQKEVILSQMKELEHTLKMVEYKCWFYEEAKKAGTIDGLKKVSIDDVPEKHKEIYLELKSIPKEK